MKIFTSFLCIIAMGISTLSAQINHYDLLLKNKIFTPEENLNVQAAENEILNGKVFRIIQFFATPDAAHKQQLKEHGITLTDYLPRFAYFASIPANISSEELEQLKIRAVLPVSAEMKIDELIQNQPYPDWALNEPGTIDLVFSIYKSISLPEQVEGLTQFNNTVLKINNYTNTITARIPTDKIAQMAALPFVQYVEAIMPPPVAENYVGRSMHRSGMIDNSIPGGLKYDGTGVHVALLDDGRIGPHLDYHGRIAAQYMSRNAGDHGDHVAGTIMGAGNLNPKHKGMAPGAIIYVYDASPSYQGFDSIYNHYYTENIRITSTSYSNGCNAGYTSFAREMDIQSNMMPSLLHVFSAGNNGTSNCNYGAGSTWGNITGGHKVGKNVIAVGNLTDNDVIANSSSRGPAKDGRIKPEVCAKGTNVVSPIEGNNYASFTGTSMSAPGVSGSLAQLYHAYRDLNNGQDPDGALMKGIIMNTADDLGNKGPDFIYGFGKINNYKSYQVIKNNYFIKDSISQGNIKNHTITVPANTGLVKVMIYWHDKEGAVNASPALVNDLDMVVKDQANVTVKPLVLDYTPNATTLDNIAKEGRDSVNNVEQVLIEDPAAGNYTVSVSGFNVPDGPQKYYLVYYFEDKGITLTYPFGGESFRNGEAERIQWDAYGNTGNFTLEFSINNGATWNLISSSIPGTARSHNWALPPFHTGKIKMRISRGSVSDTTDAPFSLIGVPDNFQHALVGQDSLFITWDSINSATGYDVFVLGQKYMDSIGTTATNSFLLTNANLNSETWIAVRARGADNNVGRRSIASRINPQNDVAIIKIVSPDNSVFPSCMALNNLKVKAEVKNGSLQDLSNVTIKYQFNNNAVVTESINANIKKDSIYRHTFSTPITLNATGINNLKVWVENNGDIYNNNDSARVQVGVSSRSSISAVNEQFENMSSCSTDPDCEFIICNLINGWYNESNLQGDHIDWRVNAGPTPSLNTGPAVDYNTATALGKYIYLEASGDCTNKTGKMTSGCFDLSKYISPELSFAYHMNGADMGSLSVDIFADGVWNEDVFKVEVTQGNFWQKTSIPLYPFGNGQILIRFRGITGVGPYSDIAIDDIIVSNSPVASFITTPDTGCVNSMLTFTDNSFGAGLSYNWNFGQDANPATSNAAGPNQVTYSTTGTKTVELIVNNGVNADTIIKMVMIIDTAVASFDVIPNGLTINLNNTSSAANNYKWLFGSNVVNGNTSTYTFNAPGTYDVSLIASNICSIDTLTKSIAVFGSGIDNADKLKLQIYPNPGDGYFTLSVSEATGIDAEVVDISGKKITEFRISEKSYQLDLRNYSKGVYFLKLRNQKGFIVRKLVIE